MRWSSVVLGLIVVTVVVGTLRFVHRDVTVCREVLRGLVTGRFAAQRSMDWEHLEALGLDVGETYRRLPNAEERQRYQRAFVENFSKAFREAQGRLDAFTRWRIVSREGQTTLVAADYAAANRTLVFTITDSGWGRRRVEAFQWQ